MRGATLLGLLGLFRALQASLFDDALALHEAGDHDAALGLYQDFVASTELQRDADGVSTALHNMAIIQHGRGENVLAVELVSEALRARPDPDANFLHTQGVVLRAVGRAPDAVAAFRAAVDADPTAGHAHLGLANTLHFDVADRLAGVTAPGGAAEEAPFEEFRAATADAAVHYARAVDAFDAQAAREGVGGGGGGSGGGATGAGYGPSLFNDWAIALQKAGRHADAAAVLTDATARWPADLQSRGNLAVALKELGDLAGAERHGRAASALAPGNAQVRYNLGLCLQARGDLGAAAGEW